MTNGNDKINPITTTHYGEYNQQHVESHGGLTKREHFAAMALQGLLSSDEQLPYTKPLATLAVDYADALIKALNESE